LVIAEEVAQGGHDAASSERDGDAEFAQQAADGVDAPLGRLSARLTQLESSATRIVRKVIQPLWTARQEVCVFQISISLPPSCSAPGREQFVAGPSGEPPRAVETDRVCNLHASRVRATIGVAPCRYPGVSSPRFFR
jgi:hypothetical protein